MLPRIYQAALIVICGVHLVFCADLINNEVDVSHCQEFRTRADKYVNFFSLDYFLNEKSANETFRYNFFVKGDRDIYIIFTEADTVQSGSKCYEFALGFVTGGQPAASAFKTALDGSQRVRTEEAIPLSSKNPMAVTIVAKKDGEIQMYVANKPFPLIRFPDTSLNPRFLSFTTRGGVPGQFYFNCLQEDQLRSADARTVYGISEERAYPIVYISLKVNLLDRQKATVKLNLVYNMTLHNPAGPLSTRKNELMDLSKETNFQLPKLLMFSNNQGIKRSDPAYMLSIDTDKRVKASASEDISLVCHETQSKFLYCDLAFGLEGLSHHLRYHPAGPLINSTIAKFADIKIFQGSNSLRTSDIAFKDDIVMHLKFDTREFKQA